MLRKLVKLAMMCGLAAGFSAFADEVLYFMVDNPEIQDWRGALYNASEAADHGRTITDARVAVFATTDTANYLDLNTHDDVDVIYLDLYYEDGGSWTVWHDATPPIDSAFVSGGVLSPEGGASYGIASLDTLTLKGKDLSGLSFAIELGNWDPDPSDPNAVWALEAISQTATYAELERFRSTELAIQGQMPWTPTAYAAPEPSGGLLTLLGCALLALRRKRKVDERA